MIKMSVYYPDYGASLLNAPNSLALIAGLGAGTSRINRQSECRPHHHRNARVDLSGDGGSRTSQ